MNKETKKIISYIDSLKTLPETEGEKISEYNRCMEQIPDNLRGKPNANIKYAEFAGLLALKRKTGSLSFML